MNKKGMSLVETVVAVALMMTISGALVSLAMAGIAQANASRMRAQADRIANYWMELVKNQEMAYKSEIQSGNWVHINQMLIGPLTGFRSSYFGNVANFFTLKVESVPPPTCQSGTTSCQIVVTVYWTYRGVTPNCNPGSEKNCVRLATVLTRWL